MRDRGGRRLNAAPAGLSWFTLRWIGIGGALLAAALVIAFAPGWLFAVGWNPFGWSFIASLTYPSSLAVRGAVIWMILGVLYLLVLYTVKPSRVAEMARVHLDEEPVPVAVPSHD